MKRKRQGKVPGGAHPPKPPLQGRVPQPRGLSPQAALLLAFQVALLALLLEQPRNLLLLALAAAGFGLWSAGRGRWGWLLAALLVGTWSVTLSQGLFYAWEPRTAVLRLLPPTWFPLGSPPGLYLYREGLWHGLVQSLRFSTIAMLGAGLLGRYATDELAAGLRGLRVPGALCFLFSMALRFLPVLWEEARATWNGQHFRGFRLRRVVSLVHGPLGSPRALALPLLAAQVRKSDEVAAALLSRGYTPGSDGLPAPPPLARGEFALCLMGGAGLASLVLAQLLTRLHLSGGWTWEGLQWLYRLVVTHV